MQEVKKFVFEKVDKENINFIKAVNIKTSHSIKFFKLNFCACCYLIYIVIKNKASCYIS